MSIPIKIAVILLILVAIASSATTVLYTDSQETSLITGYVTGQTKLVVVGSNVTPPSGGNGGGTISDMPYPKEGDLEKVIVKPEQEPEPPLPELESGEGELPKGEEKLEVSLPPVVEVIKSKLSDIPWLAWPLMLLGIIFAIITLPLYIIGIRKSAVRKKARK